jgi:prolyl 4-hydroxylase
LNGGRAAEGVHLLREVASTGDPHALFIFADLTWSGNMVEQDPARGRLLFEQAAAAGHTQANLLVTNLIANGVAGKRDWSMAVERLEAEGRKLSDRQRALDLVRSMDLDAAGDPKRISEPQVIADRPHARIFERLFTLEECDYLIRAAEGRFEPSMVYNRSRELVRDTIRTSDGAAFHWLIEDPAIHAINRRVAAATSTAYDQGEPLQALRYSPGQEYRPHFDFVDGANNQRLWTALIYLNEDYEDGETVFVRTGLKVRGKTGDMLLFRNALEDDSGDPLAEHAGMPVTTGTKYLATRWIRERRWIP